ncbi:MAG: hypothetical protein ACFCUT_21045 [Kiloniellaceae bacterium]
MRDLFAAAFGAAFLLPGPASALDLLCYPRGAMVESLEASHGETPAFAGVTSAGSLFEVLVSPDGSFTALVTFPDGLTCPIAMGEGWRHHPETSVDPAA